MCVYRERETERQTEREGRGRESERERGRERSNLLAEFVVLFDAGVDLEVRLVHLFQRFDLR
jgi:hypothetical protein